MWLTLAINATAQGKSGPISFTFRPDMDWRCILLLWLAPQLSMSFTADVVFLTQQAACLEDDPAWWRGVMHVPGRVVTSTTSASHKMKINLWWKQHRSKITLNFQKSICLSLINLSIYLTVFQFLWLLGYFLKILQISVYLVFFNPVHSDPPPPPPIIFASSYLPANKVHCISGWKQSVDCLGDPQTNYSTNSDIPDNGDS